MLETIFFAILPILGFSSGAGWTARLPVLQTISALLIVPVVWWAVFASDTCEVSKSCDLGNWQVIGISASLSALILGSWVGWLFKRNKVPIEVVYVLFAATVFGWAIVDFGCRYFGVY